MIWLVVRFMMPAKIELWCDIRNVEKATAKIRPRYLARSPRSICTATKFINAPFLNSLYDVNTVHRDSKKEAKNFGSSLADPLDEDVHQAIDQPVVLNERERTRDQQRGDAGNAGPKSLRRLLDVLPVQLPGVEAPPDAAA